MNVALKHWWVTYKLSTKDLGLFQDRLGGLLLIRLTVNLGEGCYSMIDLAKAETYFNVSNPRRTMLAISFRRS